MIDSPELPDSADVVVVGAGLRGCALRARQNGLDVVVLEASDDVGGRVRTDDVDGFLLDRGFQLYNPRIPRAGGFSTIVGCTCRPWHRASSSRSMDAAVLVSPIHAGALPGRFPAFAPIGSVQDKARLAAMAADDARRPAHHLLAATETTTRAALRERGVSDRAVDRLIRPFFAGTFRGRARDIEPVLRPAAAHVRSRHPSVPATGMGDIPKQLARELAGRIATQANVTAVSPAEARLVTAARCAPERTSSPPTRGRHRRCCLRCPSRR